MKGEDALRKNISGALIRKLRKRRDWTQREFSKRLREAGWKKCTRSWLSRIESGEVTLRDRDLPYFYSVMGEEFDAEFGALMFRKVERSLPSGNPVMNTANLMNFVPVFLLSFSSA